MEGFGFFFLWWEKIQNPLQQWSHGVGQKITGGKFLPLFPGQLECSGTALFLGHHGDLFREAADFFRRQVLLEGKQGVQIHAQCPGQGGKQGDIGIIQPLFPFVHRRSGDPQKLGQGLLRQSLGCAAGADDFVDFHKAPSFGSIITEGHRRRNGGVRQKKGKKITPG